MNHTQSDTFLEIDLVSHGKKEILVTKILPQLTEMTTKHT
jgi:hypothetical protein